MAVALIIIYNHKYERNIPLLEEHYGKAFSNIFHVVPFYHGSLPNVIPVYENSRHFQGYIAQAAKSFTDSHYDHYLFVADDLVLNPAINENNYVEYFQVDERTVFLPELKELHSVKPPDYWARVHDAYYFYLHKTGVEAARELPDANDTLEHFRRHGIEVKPFEFDQIYSRHPFPKGPRWRQQWASYLNYHFLRWKSRLMRRRYGMAYPLVGGYSDIIVIPASIVRRFCHYCGVYAALDLFVEVAIPTALCQTAERIVTEKDTRLKGKAMWSKSDFEIIKPYHQDLQQLIDSFPADCLYLHPIKLSQWKTAAAKP